MKRFSQRLISVHRNNLRMSSSVRVMVPIADGSEDLETVTIADVLTRGGAKVILASVGSSHTVTCAHGIKLIADVLVSESMHENYDMIVCPGGLPGSFNLRDSCELRDLLLRQHSSGKYVAAMCAAPAAVLATHGILAGKVATCYPAPKFRDLLPTVSNDEVVIDGNVITSQGPATAIPFALALVKILFGPDKATEVANDMLYKYHH